MLIHRPHFMLVLVLAAALAGCSGETDSLERVEPVNVVDKIDGPISVEAFTPVPVASNRNRTPVSGNLIRNGEFEEVDGDEGLQWYASETLPMDVVTEGRPIEGARALRVTVDTADAFIINQDLKAGESGEFWATETFKAGAPHWLRGFVKTDAVGGSVIVEVWDVRVDQDQLLAKSDAIPGDADWTAISLDFRIPVRCSHLSIRVHCKPGNQTGGALWLDGFDLRQIKGERKENLLSNAGFEDRSADSLHPHWNTGLGEGRPGLSEAALEGERCLVMDVSGGADMILQQNVGGLKPGQRYVFSAYVKTEDVKGNVQLWAQDVGPVASGKVSGTSDWTEISIEFTLPKGMDTVNVYVTRGDDGVPNSSDGRVFIDACALYEA